MGAVSNLPDGAIPLTDEQIAMLREHAPVSVMITAAYELDGHIVCEYSCGPEPVARSFAMPRHQLRSA